MSIKRDSRNTMTSSIQIVSGVTGLPTSPAYLDLRERAPRDMTSDQPVELLAHVMSPANLATITLNDPRLYWAIMDVSNVIDPFELQVGDQLLVPQLDRLLFQVLDTDR